ncbi:hypothetical protein LCL97_24160 [Seohaeicola saemankumensis]|nr:hypothetical protein [Seohaeicola saemankumensis]MCA0873932.1 hypothetical protein [Seohaeicola saemankumensis]
MSELTEAQHRFVDRFIVRLPDALVSPAGDAVPLVLTWQSAKDKVDDELRVLSDTVRLADEPDAAEVAADVVNLLGPVRVQMLTALMEFDKAPLASDKRDKVTTAVSAARAWLGSDPRVAGVDNNPWKVPVSVAATLGSALDEIERSTARIAGIAK